MNNVNKIVLMAAASFVLHGAAASAGTNMASPTDAKSAEKKSADKKKCSCKKRGHGHSKTNFYEKYDLNKNKSVSEAEHRAGRDLGHAATDFNNDGNVMADEYVAEFEVRLDQQLAKRRDSAIKQAYVRFGVIDTDKDGIITRAEFQAIGEKSFTRRDTNKDGVVDEKDAGATKKH